MTKSSDKFYQLRIDAYQANMQLPKLGLVMLTFGNVSAADHGQGVFAIKPSGVPYESLTPEAMVVVDFHGEVVDGDLRPSSDTNTHAVLYRHWPGIGGIAHTHSTYATAWAQAQLDIPIYGTTHADYLTVNVPCASPLDDEMILGDYEVQTGFQFIKCLSERGLAYEQVEMMLIANHAPFTWGRTCQQAVVNSAILESVAKMAYLSTQIRPDIVPMKNTLIQKHFERKHGANAYYGQSPLQESS